MKRLISLLLVILLCISSLSLSSYATDSQLLYSDDDMETLYYDFSYVSTMVETMYGNDTAVAYWKYAHDMEKKGFASWLIDASTKIIGEHPDKEFYTEMLINMIAAMEVGAANQIKNQSNFDDLKDIKDYGMDLLDIGANIIGLEGKIKGLEKAIEVTANAIDLVDSTIDELMYYEAAIKNYATSELFLSAIADNTDNVTLRNAANDLRKISTSLFNERVNLISNISDDVAVFSIQNFVSDLSFSIMKNLDAYKTDPYVKDIVDLGEKAYNSLDDLLDKGEAIFDLVMLGGDLILGTTNTFKRHNEMEAMADIADALVLAYKSVVISQNDLPQNLYSNIFTKCEYYKMLLSTHLRGEYLIYQLNYNDAGILSTFTRFFDQNIKNKSNSIQDWYEKQTKTCEEYYNMITGLFGGLLKPPAVIDTGFNLHNGFIVPVDQKTTVPEGYIGVYSFDDLKKIADSCPSSYIQSPNHSIKTEFNTAKYILMNDITCPAEYDSAAIFYGVIDGNGYTIRNLSKPLFIQIDEATIKNLGFEINCVHVEDMMETEYSFGAIATHAGRIFVSTSKNVIDNCFTKGIIDITCRSGSYGGLLGSAAGDSLTFTTITNCHNEANINIKTRQGGETGGICGGGTQTQNCFNKGNVSISATCEFTNLPEGIEVYAGGIQGQNGVLDCTIKDCFNTGSISASTDIGCRVYCGGIIGFDDGKTIENCYNLGNISNNCAETFSPNDSYDGPLSPNYNSGGIAGVACNSNIKNCWNSGKISSKVYSGGICASLDLYECSLTDCYNNGSVSGLVYAGGIIGTGDVDTDESCTISRCYNTGSVTSSLNYGAIAGNVTDGENAIKSCYYINNGLTATGTGANYSGATQIDATQFKDKNTFVDFDFVKVWRMKEGDPAPTLRN